MPPSIDDIPDEQIQSKIRKVLMDVTVLCYYF